MSRRTNRRRFLARAGLASAGSVLILRDPRAAFSYQANDRCNLAVVGMAGYGAYHGLAEGIHLYENVTYAISCDVDLRKVRRVYDLWKSRRAEWPSSDRGEQRRAAELYSRLAETPPPLYSDFRRMLDECDRQIDAVVVATPDHTHAVIAAAALGAGKPVFCEKPLTISAHEARALRRLARETRLPTQMNNQGSATPALRRGVELVRQGVIGAVEQVHVFFSRGGRNFQQPPQGRVDVPPELEWNLWLAQVAWRDYHPDWINRIGWRETSIGELGNFAPHTANLAFRGLNLARLWDEPTAAPIRIEAECSEVNHLSYPRWERIRWSIPARGEQPPVTLTWHHGPEPDYAPGSREMFTVLLRDHGATDEEVKSLLPYAGCLLVGSKGLLATNSHNTEFTLLPRARFEDVEQRRPLETPESPGHLREWLEACRGSGTQPMSNFEYAAAFAELLNVGSIATRFPGETLEFHPASGTISNHPRAAEFLKYPYRDGWTI